MGMDVLAQQLFKIAFMVLLGYGLKKAGIITPAMQKGLSSLLLTCVMPLDILTAGNLPLEAALIQGLWVSALISIVYYIVVIGGMSLLVKKLPIQEDRRSLVVAMVALGNVGFVGYPLIRGLFGTEGYMYTVVHNFVYQILVGTVGVRLMDATEKIRVSKFLRSPLVIAPVVAITMYLTPLQWPTVVNEVFGQVGGMMVPLSMFIIGGSLADIKLSTLWSDKWSWFVSALRLVVSPLLVLGTLLLLGIGGVVGATAVILSGLCSGTLCVVLAQQYNRDVGFATATVMQTVVLMAPMLPILFLLINWLMPV